MILYTADLHFGHNSVIGFDHRPFADVDEMDRVMIELWNGRVQPDDMVYIVGDLCHRSANPPEWYLKKLKGHKILILGNHDGPILHDPAAIKLLEGVEQMMIIRDGDKKIHLCHYPMTEWQSYYHGSWHIYGHIHNRQNEAYKIMRNKKRALNAGCMINHYIPVSFDELVKNNESYEVFPGRGE